MRELAGASGEEAQSSAPNSVLPWGLAASPKPDACHSFPKSRTGQEAVLIWGLLSVVGLPHRECVLGQGSSPGGLHPAGPPSPCPALAYLA